MYQQPEAALRVPATLPGKKFAPAPAVFIPPPFRQPYRVPIMVPLKVARAAPLARYASPSETLMNSAAMDPETVHVPDKLSRQLYKSRTR